MKFVKRLNKIRALRSRRATAKIEGTAERPRLAVHRTNRFITVQLIDDVKANTLAYASSRNAVKGEKKTKGEAAFVVGEEIGKKAVEKGIKKAVFDRRSYKFHGRVKNVALGAKKSGLTI